MAYEYQACFAGRSEGRVHLRADRGLADTVTCCGLPVVQSVRGVVSRASLCTTCARIARVVDAYAIGVWRVTR